MAIYGAKENCTTKSTEGVSTQDYKKENIIRT